MTGVTRQGTGISGRCKSADMASRVLILGASGMLGSMLTRILSQDARIEVTATVRRPDLLEEFEKLYRNVNLLTFDAATDRTLSVVESQHWVINAIGITKPYIDDTHSSDVHRAIRINSLFPFKLASWAEKHDCRVIQIATDCVYTGTMGNYNETSSHDATDVYGKTKSLGEVRSNHFLHLRCSIVGTETPPGSYLLSWFLNQPDKSEVNGYENHFWNGITTYHFARLCQGIINFNLSPPSMQHVLPANRVSKYELLKLFQQHFNRHDITINPMEAQVEIDRTLATSDQESNNELWEAAGYASPPTIDSMIRELASNPSKR